MPTLNFGHILPSACRILGVTKLNSKLQLPPGIYHAFKQQQLAYIHSFGNSSDEECTLIDTNNDAAETDDQVYKYARTMEHLYLNFGMVVRKVMVNISFVVGSLCFHTLKQQAKKVQFRILRLQFQVKAILSP